jgi:hypothetical protein
MAYVSARYAPPPPPEMVAMMPKDENAPKQVIAIDENGVEWFLTDDSQVGDWLRYVEGGGTIEPYQEAKPAPEEGSS